MSTTSAQCDSSMPVVNTILELFGAISGTTIAHRDFQVMSPVPGVIATMILKTPVMRHLVNWLGVR